MLIEGYREEELLAMPAAGLAALVCTGEFRLTPTRLQLELAQIEGGGEGVLVTLGALARRFARHILANDAYLLVEPAA